MRCRTLLLPLVLAGCNVPRDPEGTLERVRAERVIRVGRVADAAPRDEAQWRQVLERVATKTGARPAIRTGALEPLLLDLEHGRLDLVVGGRFDAKTPWKPRVSLGPALERTETPAGETASHLVARNGENAWITLVERETRAVGGEP